MRRLARSVLPGEGSRDLFARALFAFVTVALAGCVDKTPPPLWPTPPPPTLARPIGEVERPEAAGPARPTDPPPPADPGPAPGPWQPATG